MFKICRFFNKVGVIRIKFYKIVISIYQISSFKQVSTNLFVSCHNNKRSIKAKIAQDYYLNQFELKQFLLLNIHNCFCSNVSCLLNFNFLKKRKSIIFTIINLLSFLNSIEYFCQLIYYCSIHACNYTKVVFLMYKVFTIISTKAKHLKTHYLIYFTIYINFIINFTLKYKFFRIPNLY